MDKKVIRAELERISGGCFITRKEVAQALGYKDPHNVDRYLHGLDRVGKKYFIPDVAASIMAGMTR